VVFLLLALKQAVEIGQIKLRIHHHQY